ncbi:MAG: diaminopimelate epimerase [Rhodovarius sp.]|nr:diaminopimelate epimerase [Rhodovarius sp.]
MALAFRKMHGAGNDFVVLDARTAPIPLTPAGAAWLADRHRGVGCEQIIRIEASDRADAFMRIFNPDGSEAGACGNATRCVAQLLMEESGRSAVVIETLAGLLPARRGVGGLIEVDMGPPRLSWQEVPLAQAMDTLHLPLGLGPVADPAACSMGNPHATFFVDRLDHLPLAEIGAQLEHHPLFPDRANIGFAQVLAPDAIRLRVWERGAGLTQACGSGACAAVVNAHRRGLTGRRVRVAMPGGELAITWRPEDGHVLMEGPAELSFWGELDAARLAA